MCNTATQAPDEYTAKSHHDLLPGSRYPWPRPPQPAGTPTALEGWLAAPARPHATSAGTPA